MRHAIFVIMTLLFAIGCQRPSDSTATGTQALPIWLAGDYFSGDGLGINCSLKLTTVGRFEFTWRGCLGEYDKNQGTAVFTDNVLVIEPEKPDVREGFQGTPTTFRVIRWGDRRYLVATEELLDFCNSINQGEEPRSRRHGNFYLQDGDWHVPISGRPALPEEWLAFLLKKPVRGRVSELVGDKQVKITLGYNDGIREGMILTVRGTDEDFFSCQLRVIDVDETESQAEYEYYGIDETPAQIGHLVSSRLFDYSVDEE